MTITRSLQAPAAVDRDLMLTSLPDITDFVVSNGGKVGEAYATLQSGDCQAPLAFYASRSQNRNSLMTYNNMSLKAFVKETSDLTDVVTYHPITAGLNWNYKGAHTTSTAHVVQVVSMLMAIFAQELTGSNGYPTASVVEMFEADQLRGIVG